MADKKIVDYIEKVMKKGFTLGQARTKLEDAHYPESKIKEAVSQVKKRRVWKASEIVFAIILVIAILSVFSDKILSRDQIVEEKIPTSEDILADAIKNKDASACLEITDETRRDICFKMTTLPIPIISEPDPEVEIIQQAASSGDSSNCASIEDETRREICEKMSSSQTSTATTSLTSEPYEQEFGDEEIPPTEDFNTILQQAQQNHDSTLCEQILDETRRDICIQMSS